MAARPLLVCTVNPHINQSRQGEIKGACSIFTQSTTLKCACVCVRESERGSEREKESACVCVRARAHVPV